MEEARTWVAAENPMSGMTLQKKATKQIPVLARCVRLEQTLQLPAS